MLMRTRSSTNQREATRKTGLVLEKWSTLVPVQAFMQHENVFEIYLLIYPEFARINGKYFVVVIYICY